MGLAGFKNSEKLVCLESRGKMRRKSSKNLVKDITRDQSCKTS